MSENKEPQIPQPLRISGIDIPVDEQSPLVLALLAVIQKQDREIQELRDEIQRLKKTTRRPKIKPSRLLLPPPTDTSGPKNKRPGSAKRHKTKALRIDLDHIIQPDDLPPAAKLEGYRDFVVQDIVVQTRNTRYRRAVYRCPDGTLLVAQRQSGHRFTLRSRAA